MKKKEIKKNKKMNDYEKSEELDCIREYDIAKKKNEKPIPFSKAISEIESKKLN